MHVIYICTIYYTVQCEPFYSCPMAGVHVYRRHGRTKNTSAHPVHFTLYYTEYESPRSDSGKSVEQSTGKNNARLYSNPWYTIRRYLICMYTIYARRIVMIKYIIILLYSCFARSRATSKHDSILTHTRIAERKTSVINYVIII